MKHKHCYALYIWCGQIIWSQCKGLIRFCDYFLAVGLSFWLVDNLLSYVLSWRMHSWKKERTNRQIALAWRDTNRCGTKWLPFHCLRDFLHYSLHRRNSGTCLWNNLPQHVSSVPSLHVFTSRLKKHFFSVSFPKQFWMYSACEVTSSLLDTPIDHLTYRIILRVFSATETVLAYIITVRFRN